MRQPPISARILSGNIALPLGLPIVGIIAVAWLLVLHAKVLAPLREPQWVESAPARRRA